VNSSYILVEDGASGVHRYQFNGSFVDTISLSKPAEGALQPVANDAVIAYRNFNGSGDHRMTLSDMTGATLAHVQYDNISYAQMVGAAKDVILFVDFDNSSSEYLLKIFNNQGTLIATHVLDQVATQAALNGMLDAVGITSDRIYLFARSAVVPNCVIYEHTLTFVGGVATNAVLGLLLHTVPTPQNNNIVDSNAQSTAIDGSLMA
jgi:hypothetical protein